jgi:O-antigen ligase
MPKKSVKPLNPFWINFIWTVALSVLMLLPSPYLYIAVIPFYFLVDRFRKQSQIPNYLSWWLFAFALSTVASIAFQNLIWVAVVSFLLFQIKNRLKFDWPKGLFPIATFLFLITFFLSSALGVNPAKSFEFVGVYKYLTFLLFFLIAAMPILVKDIQKLLIVFVYGATFCALAGIWKHFYLHQDRIDSFSGDKMVFGGTLMIALLLQAYLLMGQPKKPFYWVSLSLLGSALLFTQTRGAWIGFAAGFLVISWFLNQRVFISGILSAFLIFLILPSSLQYRVKSIWDPSQTERVLIWKSGLNISKDYPLFGIGDGNMPQVYPKYKSIAASEPTVPHLHDNFLQILVQNGWIGLLVYLFWIFSYFFMAIRFKARNSEENGLNLVFSCLFFSTLIWGLTEYTFSHQFMNVQLFLLGLQSILWKKHSK